MSCDVTDFIHPAPLVAITETCLAYLGSIRNEGDIYGIYEYFPLARYAAETWVSFAKQAEVSEELVDSVVKFLQDRAKFRLWARVFYTDEPFGDYEGMAIMLPLYFTCLNGLKVTAQKLLLSGADINEEGDVHGPALLAATKRGQQDIIQLLLESGANINAESGLYGSALQVASQKGRQEIVELLLERGANANPNIEVGHYGSALQSASAGGHKETVQLLLQRGANINAEGGYYGSALQAALRRGRSEIYQILLDNGAYV